MSKTNKQLTKALNETKEEPLLSKLKFEVNYFISNLFTPITVFKEGVIRLFKWLPIIWKDRDFDEHYMVEILQFKLQQMAELHMKHGVTVSRYETAEELLHATHLLELTKMEDLIDSVPLTEEGEMRKKRTKEAFNYIANNMNGWWD